MTDESLSEFLALPALQRDLLVVLNQEGSQNGLEAKQALEAQRYADINNGRLYNNLDKLAERGIITKTERDGRTNEYALTRRGKRALASYHGWVTNSPSRSARSSARPLEQLSLRLNAPGESDE